MPRNFTPSQRQQQRTEGQRDQSHKFGKEQSAGEINVGVLHASSLSLNFKRFRVRREGRKCHGQAALEMGR